MKTSSASRTFKNQQQAHIEQNRNQKENMTEINPNIKKIRTLYQNKINQFHPCYVLAQKESSRCLKHLSWSLLMKPVFSFSTCDHETQILTEGSNGSNFLFYY
ncbi:hypothetical protein GOODEAATRI_033322 [Goodea atripinnis]|uniref:Uncharacterized protein n=1 Tax=Goodea atripinnis TaxID=208336 RepID=A0ABV0N680_9TELE